MKHEVEYIFYIFHIWFSKLDFEIVCLKISYKKKSGFPENSMCGKNVKNSFSTQILNAQVVLGHTDVIGRSLRIMDH